MGTTVVLNHHVYWHLEPLAEALRKNGLDVTMLADEETKIKDAASCDRVVRCKNIFDEDEVLEKIGEIDQKYGPVEKVVNNACRLSFVYFHALKKFGDHLGHGRWILNVKKKHEMRRILNAAGISTVKFALIKSEGDLEGAAETTGFPAVIKPVSGQASEGVYKVGNKSELAEKYRKIKGDVSDEFLLEEYLIGDEYTADGYKAGGDVTVAIFNQKFFSLEDDGFRDVLYITPPRDLNDALKEKTKKVVCNALKTLGVNDSLFHIEFRVVDGEPKIIEINPRLGGGLVDENVRAAAGISLIEIYADIICGKPVPKTLPSLNGIHLDVGVFIANEGKVKKIAGVDEIKAMKGVEKVFLNVSEGDVISRIKGERYALYCSAHAASYEEALRLYKNIEGTLKLEFY